MLIALYSPNGTYDATFLANYAYINLARSVAAFRRASATSRSSAPANTPCACG